MTPDRLRRVFYPARWPPSASASISEMNLSKQTRKTIASITPSRDAASIVEGCVVAEVNRRTRATLAGILYALAKPAEVQRLQNLCEKTVDNKPEGITPCRPNAMPER